MQQERAAPFVLGILLLSTLSFTNSIADGPSDDDCSTAATLSGSEVTCSGTKTLVKTAQIVNQVGQTAAAGVVNSMGAAAQTKAQQTGNINDMQRAAADIADNGANAQLVQGSVNAALGTWQLIQAQKLSKAAKDIRNKTGTGVNLQKGSGVAGDGQAIGDSGFLSSQGYAANAIKAYELNKRYDLQNTLSDDELAKLAKYKASPPNAADPAQAVQAAEYAQLKKTAEAREKEIKRKNLRMLSDIEGKGAQAAGEVRGVSNEASAAGGASLITGLGQIAAGIINKKAAQNLRDASNMKLDTGSGTTFTPTGGFGNYNMDTQTPSQNTVISGDGDVGPTQQAGEQDKEKTDSRNTDFDLGPGSTGPKDNSNLVGGGPAAGGFNVGQEGGVVSGGGGGGGGGGSTGAATPEAEPNSQATMADGKKKNSDSYNQTGAFFTPGGGGGQKGADGGAGGPSLADMLAQFMPKKEDEGSKNGILDFGGGPGRTPASEAPYSFLDKRTNLFDNIHRAYQDANKRGAL